VEYFDKDNEYEAVKELSDRLNLELNKEGIVTISVDVKTSFFPMFLSNIDSTKKFAAELTNSFAEALDKINREKISTKAKRARIYIENELKKTRLQLDSVEIALMNFQEKNKTVALPEQITAAIEAAAKIKTEMMQTEVEIGLMSANLREDSKEMRSLRKKLEQLQEQYDKMELGNQDYLLAFREVPELGKELATLIREVKIQNEVYMLLQQQYYKERIQENRDLPTVEVLDKAITPLRHTEPRTIFSTITGGVFIFLAMSLIIVLGENRKYLYLNKNKDKNIV
jgi:capsule polysaccharide export protein KpsE/RkpR